jgi:ribonucleoside-diphosphate reductase alpha chain
MNSKDEDMFVVKRNGHKEVVSFDKILKRIKKVGLEANIKINYTSLAMKVIDQLYSGISTTKIDELTSEQCASMSSTHLEYNVLAGRISVSNHHKNTKASFYQVMKELHGYKDQHGVSYPLVSDEFFKIVNHYGKEKVDSICDYQRDYLIDYFGFKTLERSYLMRINKRVMERPQHMWLRVSIGIHGKDWDKVVESYHYMSLKYFTHATPTLFNAGTPYPQLSSCYLMAMESDSIDGIFNTLKDCALISKWAGGIGLHIHNIRASGSQIRGTNGSSNGIVPMLKVFNNTAKYVDQCVVPETWIYTTQGPMAIEDVISNETEILNSEGKGELIHNVLEHPYEGPILKIRTSHSIDALYVTAEHPIFTLDGQHISGLDFSQIISAFEKKTIECDFMDAKDITVEDYIVYTIPQYTKDQPQILVDDCYMYGILLGDGFISSAYYNAYVKHCTNTMSFIKQYFAERFVPFVVENQDIRWTKSNTLPFRHSDFFNKMEKRIRPAWLNLPVEKLVYIMKGLMETSLFYKHSFTFHHSSRRLLEDIRYLCLRLGILTTGTSDSITIPKVSSLCDDPDDEKYSTFFRYKNYLFSRVCAVDKSEYHGTLYDLQMADVHDYMIHHGIVHNGGGKRNGSFAIYLEPWHADIEMFLQMRKNHGDEELKARDLFYALWVPDLFMERVKSGGEWTLMCPNECPGLSDVIGDEFVSLYTKYEQESRGRKTIPARDLWFQILDAQMETGTPYLLFKDTANRKSNQKNVGVIKSSNLCVSPQTHILTRTGQYPIYSLYAGNYPPSEQDAHRTVEIWNGSEFSEVEVFKTGENQSFIEINTSDGASLKCTPYHKFYIRDGTGSVETKEARELIPGDLLESSNFPTIEDGPEKYESAEVATQTGVNAGVLNLKRIPDTHFQVPINYSLQDKLNWLSSFIEPYVVEAMKANMRTVMIPSASPALLEDLKYMLQTCGLNTKIQWYSDKLDGAVGEWQLTTVQLRYLYHHHALKFHTFEWTEPPLTEDEMNSTLFNPNIRVVFVNKTNLVDDSYCFTEPLKHAGIFNGIRTGQCTEILEYSDAEETAVCNLASIALPAFIHDGVFDFEELHKATRVVTRNLNKVIDINFYPTPKTKLSNMRHRPIGIGVQGLADVFFIMKLSFTCAEAKQLNKDIFETMYHAALEESCQMAIEEGAYETFKGSPASQGELQFDLWKVQTSTRYNWDELKNSIKTHGLRNSLLMAPMPTASTSQILGYNECFEPITSNIYSRRTLAGEFILVNKYLMREMLETNQWNENFKNHMVANNGSIQSLEYLDPELRERYRTVWEIPMRDLIDMAADRGAFICQSQSLNLWLEDPNYNTMTSMHFYSWNKGLKTGIYYLRRRPRHQAQQFTIEPEKKEECLMCSS